MVIETPQRDFRVGKEPTSEPGENSAFEGWIKEDMLLEELERQNGNQKLGCHKMAKEEHFRKEARSGEHC